MPEGIWTSKPPSPGASAVEATPTHRYLMSERNWISCPLNLTWSKRPPLISPMARRRKLYDSSGQARTSGSNCVHDFSTTSVSTSMRLMRYRVDRAFRGVDIGFRPKPSSISAPCGEYHPQRFHQDIHVENHASRTHIAHVERYPSAVVRIVASRYLPEPRDSRSGR